MSKEIFFKKSLLNIQTLAYFSGYLSLPEKSYAPRMSSCIFCKENFGGRGVSMFVLFLEEWAIMAIAIGWSFRAHRLWDERQSWTSKIKNTS